MCMQLYNQTKGNNMNMNEQSYLLNIDSNLGLKELSSDFVDLVLTDPPYGIADKSKLTKVRREEL